MTLEVHFLDAARQDDFFRLHCPKNGAGWCSCVAWWVATWQGWDERTADENRMLRESLFARGQFDGYILSVDGTPAGWCQCAPRDWFTKLRTSYRLAPDPEIWALTCFFIAPAFRGRGLAHHLLDAVLRDLELRGVKHVQAFPTRGDALAAGEVWTGPESVFTRAGFHLERDDPEHPVYGRPLDPSGPRSAT